MHKTTNNGRDSITTDKNNKVTMNSRLSVTWWNMAPGYGLVSRSIQNVPTNLNPKIVHYSGGLWSDIVT